jgi:cold shock CspA family protein
MKSLNYWAGAVAAVVIGLSLPMVASAQNYPYNRGDEHNRGYNQGDRFLGTRDRVQGYVTNIDYQNSYVTLQSSSGLATYRATPTQVRQLRQGQRVSLRVENFGNVSWIAGNELGGVTGRNRGFVGNSYNTGTVRSVDQASGLITISDQRGGDRLYSAHPDLLSRLREGQYVDFSFYASGGKRWLSDINASSRGGRFYR